MPLIQTQEDKDKEQDYYGSPASRIKAISSTNRSGVRGSGNPRFNVRMPNNTVTSDKNETLDDLEDDESFQADARVFLDYLETDDDIFETLRDSDYNIVKGINRAMTSGKWPEDVKQSYARLRTRFDSADTGSLNQWVEATKDIGIDIVSDPTLAVSLLAAPFTGGASVAGRQAAVELTKQGLKRGLLSKIAAGTTVAKLGAAEGFIWAGADAWAREVTAESVGLTESVSGSKVMGSALLGGVAGGVIGKLVDRRVVAKYDRMVSETVIETQEALIQKDVSRFVGKEPSKLGRAVAMFTSKTVGKPAGVLVPETKASAYIKEVMQVFNPQLGREFSSPINPKARDVAKEGFFSTFNRGWAGSWSKVMEAIDPVMMNGKKLVPEMNDALVKYIRDGVLEGTDPAVVRAGNKISKEIDSIGTKLHDRGLIKNFVEHNFYSRTWLRKPIEDNPEDLVRLLMRDETNGNVDEAWRIVDELLDKKYQLGSGTTSSGSRKFLGITNDADYTKYLSSDLLQNHLDYIHTSHKKIAAYDLFSIKDAAGKITEEGAVRNLKQFRRKVINEKIAGEYEAAGLKMPKYVRQEMEELYKNVTGEGLEYFGGKMQLAKDWTSLTFQMAMLPLATLSSLTEAILPLTRVRTPVYFKGLTKGMNAGFKKISIDMLDALKVKHNMTVPQAFKELQSVGTAIDTAFSDGVERLSGSDLRSSLARKVQNGFFNANFLTQWTRGVQASAFMIGKGMVKDNLRILSKAGTNFKSKNSIRLINELSDLGINYQDGLRWFMGGAHESGNFYKSQMIKGANIFVHDVVGNTSREAGVKSHFMGHPKFDILTQFLSYPAYFSNTPLKKMITDTAEHPVRGGVRVLAGGMIMTEVARYTNWIRSNGESEEGIEPAEARFNGLVRAGMNGLLWDSAMRAKQSMDAAGTPLAGVTGLMGPAPGTFLQALMYRKGPVEVAGSLVPGKAAGNMILGKDTMDDYSTWLKSKDKELMSMVSGRKKGTSTRRSAF